MKDNTPVGEVIAAVKLVDYQDGAVVSRTIVKKTNGSVTMFAFDHEQELSEHTAPYDALVHVLEGEAEVRISGTPQRLREGDLMTMPANEPHAVRALSRFKMILTMVRS